MTEPESALEVLALEGIGEITEGDDLAALALDVLRSGDVLVITSKVVSKAEGRVVPGTDREQAIRDETVRVVARRGPTSIVENHLGLVMAAAGVDASNVAEGWLVLLPRDPDASARAIRAAILERTGANVAVIVTDTAGRAWRHGQTDIAIGAAGLLPLDSFEGRRDSYGNELAVTAPAVADEIASAAELATGKLGGRPASIVRGLGARVLPPGEDGPGARTVVREAAGDLFGLGSREAVVAALAGHDQRSFGEPASSGDLAVALTTLGLTTEPDADGGLVVEGSGDDPRLTPLLFAFGWRIAESADRRTRLVALS